jgi:hypothetical protein
MCFIVKRVAPVIACGLHQSLKAGKLHSSKYYEKFPENDPWAHFRLLQPGPWIPRRSRIAGNIRESF